MGNTKTTTVCAICGVEFSGWGNNPWPVTEKGECCMKCNFQHVIPARIALLHGNAEREAFACDED